MRPYTDGSVFSAIFHPRSIAVIGASANGENMGAAYFRALATAGFRGNLYPVSPSGGELLGRRVHTSIAGLPEAPDYAIIAVPAGRVCEVIDNCAQRGIKVVQIYTAGFAEVGAAGSALQAEVVKRAVAGGVRVIGPNCMGISSPAAHIPFGTMEKAGEPGPVAFLSQSGGLAGDVMSLGVERGIRFSKVVSFGNGCDLGFHEFLDHVAGDEESKVIGAYVEDVKDGRRLLRQLSDLRGKKPVIFCKGGASEAGVRATSSHTGALALSPALWSSVLLQTGALQVDSLDALADALVAFQQLRPHPGKRVGLVSGLSGGGGGVGVMACDACSRAGLVVPEFSAGTQELLRKVLPPVGVIARNPLDMGGTASTMEIIEASLNACAADTQIDVMIVDLHVGKLWGMGNGKQVGAITRLLVKVAREQPKPIVVVAKAGLSPQACLELQQQLGGLGIAVFPSVDRAASALAFLNAWASWAACCA